MERVDTGIKGLDDLVQGGFPKGSAVLVSGNPGTGKTILGLQFLMQGIKNKESVAYVSLGESVEDIEEQAEEFGWNLEEAQEKGLLNIENIKPKEFENKITEFEIGKKEVDRLVVDSISPISTNKENARKILHSIITGIKKSGVTTLFISELGREDGLSRDGVSEYVCDGVVKMTLLEDLDARKLEIRKLRSTKIETFKPQTFKITENGIQIKE